VFVGDAVEERLDVLAGLAAEIGLLGVKAFLFQEGRDSVAEQAFRKIALLTGGAYATFDLSSPERLVALLTAAGAYGARARRRGGGPPLVAIALNWRREMIYLLGGFLLFWLALSALKAFAAADPAALARGIKRGGGGAALLAGSGLVAPRTFRHGAWAWRTWSLVARIARLVAVADVHISQWARDAKGFVR